MKQVVEYKLHGGSVPYFIEDGGYFRNNGKLVGLTKDDIECYVPPNTTLITFETKSALADYVVELNILDIDGNYLAEQQKRDLANSWWDARH